MATIKPKRDGAVSPDYTYLKCDICGSYNILETIQGYVCQTCGIVLEIQKLQYDRPYNDDIIQYAKGLGRTKIGSKHERGFNPNFKALQRLNKYNSHTEYEECILEKAEEEISRICANLKLESYNAVKEMILLKFKEVWIQLRPNGKYRNVEKLVPIITFFCLKIRNISISRSQIIKESAITKKEFNDFYQQIERFIPEYKERNRQEYILQLILELSWHFNLGPIFHCQAKKILYKLWDGINNTTDNIVAGVVSSISVLCSKTFKNKIRTSNLCEHLGIEMSNIQTQVKQNIIKRFKVKDFVSLVKSAGLLEKILAKLGLVETPEVEIERVEKVDLIFGNSKEIFNYHDDVKYYLFSMRSENNDATILYVKIHSPLMNFEDFTKPKRQTNKFLEFEIFKYSNGKGPPLQSWNYK